MYMAKIVPMADNVVVEPLLHETNSLGIIIPDTGSKTKPIRGRVMHVGPGKLKDDGTRTAMDFKEGDMVLFSQYGPTEVKIEGKDLLILEAAQIYAKLVD